MIEKMIFVRHGDYRGDQLTAAGEESVQALVPRIERAFAGVPAILVLSSPRGRAIRTASILCDGLGLRIPGFQTHEELANELVYGLVQELEKTHTAFLRMTGEAKYVLVSTHKPIAQYYPWWYAKQHGVTVPSVSPDKGDAVCLDMAAKTLTLL